MCDFIIQEFLITYSKRSKKESDNGFSLSSGVVAREVMDVVIPVCWFPVDRICHRIITVKNSGVEEG